jgi:2-phospho-L-lactate guanylyltransferase (CobY/MobA/RfbA family)
VTHVPDPRRGQGAAVRAALDAAVGQGLPGPYLVVNADLPCASTRDLLALAGAVPDGGLALVAASDGTTNALAFADERLFEPVYGPGSAERFAALGEARLLDTPNLMDDVDTPGDLARLGDRLGEHTRRVLAALRLESAA